MKIIILNANSLLNPGDAAILAAQVDLLRTLRPGCEIAATSRTPKLDRAYFARLGLGLHPAILPAPSLWRGLAAKLARGLRDATHPGDKLRLIRDIRSSDLVVASGGGIFFSNRRLAPGLTFAQNILHVRIAQALQKPVLFFPQSFGPLHSPAARRALTRILEHPRTASIMVREPFSRRTLSRLLPASAMARVEPCPDMAFRFSPSSGGDALRLEALPRPRLAITVRDWDFPEAATRAQREALAHGYLEAVRRAARRFALERGGSVIIIPQTRGPGDFEDDRIVSRRLAGRLAKDLPPGRLSILELRESAGPEAFLSLFAQADLILATRTHAALFGLLAGRPVVSVHYQPKGLGIMASIGLADRSLPIAGLDEERLGRTLNEAHGQAPAETARLAGRISALRSEIEVRIGRVLDAVEGRR